MASDSCCNVNDNFQQKAQRSWRCSGSCGLVPRTPTWSLVSS